MNEVAALVEGEAEQGFIEKVLAPHLAGRGIDLWSRLSGQKVRHGGVGGWLSVRGDIYRMLKERAGRVCTTMFDLYALPRDWPGRVQAMELPLNQKGGFVEQALLADVCEFAGKNFRQEWFIPYVQVHEFEALLFTDVTVMASELAAACVGPADLKDRLGEILAAAGQPEAINDNWETCPSRRILGLVRRYRKPLHGPIVAARIGLDVMRQKCPHFGQWIERLERLSLVQ